MLSAVYDHRQRSKGRALRTTRLRLYVDSPRTRVRLAAGHRTRSDAEGGKSFVRAQTRAADRLGILDRVVIEHLAELRPGQIARRGLQALDDRPVPLARGRLGAGLLQHGDDAVRRAGGRDEAARREGFRRVPEL